MKNIKIACVGSDKRLFFCAEALGERGFETALYGFEGISDRAYSTRCMTVEDALYRADALVLPLPVSADGIFLNMGNGKELTLESLFERVGENTLIFAGLVNEKASHAAEKQGHKIYDYYLDPSYVLKNAAATAEGAIYLAMKNSDRTLRNSRCLVTGYGRIGSILAGLLSSLGACVGVCARRGEARVAAELSGCDTLSPEQLPEYIGGYDFIFNTVPENIFTESVAENMGGYQTYIELASAPFGARSGVLERYNVELVKGNGLPSKYCPESAGEYIADFVCEMLYEKGVRV